MKHLKKLHVQVLIGLACAVVLGIAAPQWAVAMKPIGQAFIALLKMMLAPIIFCTLVQGLAHVRDLRTLGRTGVKSLVYFEVVSTVAMALGFVLVNLFVPGAAPILDLPAEHDAVAPRRFSQVLKSMLGNRVTVVVVPNAGHAFAPDQPKAMADAIATFAKRVYAEPAKQ